MNAKPHSKWETVAVLICVPIFTLVAVQSVPGLKDPFGDWLNLMSGSLFFAAAFFNSGDGSPNIRRTISCLLLGTSAMLRLYTRTIFADSAVVSALDWVTVAIMLAGTILLFTSRPRPHGK